MCYNRVGKTFQDTVKLVRLFFGFPFLKRLVLLSMTLPPAALDAPTPHTHTRTHTPPTHTHERTRTHTHEHTHARARTHALVML